MLAKVMVLPSPSVGMKHKQVAQESHHTSCDPIRALRSQARPTRSPPPISIRMPITICEAKNRSAIKPRKSGAMIAATGAFP